VRSKRAQVRSKDGHADQSDVERQLDAGHDQSLALAGNESDRQARPEAYWAGYLAALLAERPALLDAIQSLVASTTATADSTVSLRNSNSGTVGTLLQSGDIHGNITFGGHDR
jgi:hypothetical protein